MLLPRGSVEHFKEAIMSSDVDKTIFHRLWQEVFAQANLAVADEILAPG